MAKKIIISFENNPTTSDYLNYNISINGIILPYENGETNAVIDYSVIPIESTLQRTIERTVDYLRYNFIYDKITYQQVDNSIVVFINYDNTNILVNGNISYTIVDVPNDSYNLKYFIQYSNHVNDSYYLGIYGRDFIGSPTEVNGKVIIEKGSIKDHLDAIRGGAISVDLEASADLSFEDLYTENERDFKVRLYKNNKEFFVGYLKPDGIFQSFTRDKWVITLDCVDGLGALENLSFVMDNGLRFNGKMKALDIIYYCLKRTGLELNLNTSINVYYDGISIDDNLDILSKIKMNADRFFKVDDETIMSCEEVLKSVLDIFCACITQIDGEWYIFRPNELYLNKIVSFKKYNTNNQFIGLNTKNLSKSIGSQINNFYPHHCNENQTIRIKGGASAYRLGYKYGYVSGLMPNPNFEHDSSLNFPGWTIQYPNQLVNDPNSASGMIIKNGNPGKVVYAKSDLLPVLQSDLLTLKLSWSNQRDFFVGSFIRMTINVGSYYLKYSARNDQIPFEDAIQNSKWETGVGTWSVFLSKTGTFDFPIPAMPVDGNLTIRIDYTSPEGGTLTLHSLEISPTSNSQAEIGEFHTISRATKISSIIKENKTVYNGDNLGIVYLGAILKDDGITTTSNWFRKNFYESKPLLRIAAEEQLRISQKPTKVFSGDLYGFLPYLCVLSINGLRGEFMVIEYSYDTIENVTKVKLLELFSAEIPDLIYKFTSDYGQTVKPTITS